MTHPYADSKTATFERIGQVTDWADGTAREVKVHKKPMTVVRHGDQFFALNSICPHMGGPISCGKVDVDVGKIQCPWHDWAFDLATGACANGHGLTTYQVIVEDGEVKVGWVKTL